MVFDQNGDETITNNELGMFKFTCDVIVMLQADWLVYTDVVVVFRNCHACTWSVSDGSGNESDNCGN